MGALEGLGMGGIASRTLPYLSRDVGIKGCALRPNFLGCGRELTGGCDIICRNKQEL